MQVRVADSAKKNFDLHISRGRLAPFERERLQRLVRRVGGVTFRCKHVVDHVSLYSIFPLRYTERTGRRMTNRKINLAAPGAKAAWRRRIPRFLILPSSFSTPSFLIETRSLPRSLAATRRGFTFYVRNPISSIETRSLPTLACCYPGDFTLITRTAPCLRQLL